jgi:ankyrin repeat protein
MDKFYRACIQNNIDIIKDILDNNKDTNLVYSSNDIGNTCTHLCAIHQNYNLMFSFIKKYPKLLSYVNNEGKTIPIILANQDMEILIKLLEIYPKDYIKELSNVDYYNKTIIHYLIDNYKDKDYNLFKKNIDKLISYGVNINYPKEMTPINYASIISASKKIISLLLKKKADPNIKTLNGLTPLITYIKKNKDPQNKDTNNKDIIKLLLEYKSDINFAGLDEKFLPLNIALKNNDYDIVELLLQYKPDYNYTDNNLNTSLHNAIIYNNSNNNIPNNILSKLIKNTNINSININGLTPLHLLMKTKNINIYEYNKELSEKIIKNELDFSIKDNKNNTPIKYTKNSKLIKFINLLSNDVLKILVKDKCKNKIKYIDKHKCKTLIKSEILNKTNKKLSNIKIPIITKNTNHGLFNADLVHNIIYLLGILKKYKNIFIPFQYFIKDKYKNNLLYVKDYNLYRTEEGQTIGNILNIYSEYFFSFMPYLILWNSNNLYYYNKNINLYIKNSLYSKKVRFIIFKLSLVQHSEYTHANVLIYDKKKNILIRFDPYGTTNTFNNEQNELDNFIIRIMKKAINNKIIYKKPNDYMNNSKFQLISDEYGNNNRKLGDPVGYCLAWIYWFIELIVNNPDKDIKQLVNETLKSIIIHKNNNINNSIITYIRNYSKKLDDMKNIFLKNAKISKNNIYNIDYDNNNLNKIINYINNEFQNIMKNNI